MARMSAAGLEEFLTNSFPHSSDPGICVELVQEELIRVRQKQVGSSTSCEDPAASDGYLFNSPRSLRLLIFREVLV